jgi:protein-tyrosine phosphatase
MDESNREIVFEGCFNFRDLGGYRTSDGSRIAWRRLFRSDHLSLLSGGDCQRMERDLGIITVLDLRDTQTVAARGPARLGVRCVNVPLLSDEVVAQSGPKIAESSPRTFMRHTRDDATAEAVAAVFALLADESSYPLVFHCLGGKDRTGLVAALVLGVLGVDDEDIARDYAMTESNMARTIERMRKRGLLPEDGSFTKEIPREFFETPPSAMISLLQEIREQHGSVRGYVTSCGVDATALDGLARALLPPGVDA